MNETNGNAAAYAASTIFVGVGVVYAILLVATSLSVLLIPVALAAGPFVAALFVVSAAALPGFPPTFSQVLRDFVEKAGVQWTEGVGLLFQHLATKN